MVRKLHSSKSHKRRHSRKHSRKHSRRYTRKRGGGCPCSGAGASTSPLLQAGGRGGADLGHAFTTGASQDLYQITGRTPGLSSGGGKGAKNLAKRQSNKAARLAAHTTRAESLIAIPSHLASNSLSPNASAYIPSNKLRNKLKQNKENSEEFNELMREINKKRNIHLNPRSHSLSANAPNFIPSKDFNYD